MEDKGGEKRRREVEAPLEREVAQRRTSERRRATVGAPMALPRTNDIERTIRRIDEVGERRRRRRRRVERRDLRDEGEDEGDREQREAHELGHRDKPKE